MGFAELSKGVRIDGDDRNLAIAVLASQALKQRPYRRARVVCKREQAEMREGLPEHALWELPTTDEDIFDRSSRRFETVGFLFPFHHGLDPPAGQADLHRDIARARRRELRRWPPCRFSGVDVVPPCRPGRRSEWA